MTTTAATATGTDNISPSEPEWSAAKRQFDTVADEIIAFAALLRTRLPPSEYEPLARLEQRVAKRRSEIEQMIATSAGVASTVTASSVRPEECRHCGKIVSKALFECATCGVD